MSNKSTKYDKRCTKLHDKMTEFVKPLMDEHFDPEGSLTRGALGGIIRDMTAFYIQENYGGNVNFYRGYHAPTNYTIECVDAFLEDNVTYTTISNFYHRRIDKFKNDVADVKIDNPSDQNVVILFSQKYRGFICSDNHGIISIGVHEHATKFDYFMNDTLTKQAIVNCILPEGYYDDQDGMLDDIILVRPKRPELYKMSETYLDLIE